MVYFGQQQQINSFYCCKMSILWVFDISYRFVVLYERPSSNNHCMKAPHNYDDHLRSYNNNSMTLISTKFHVEITRSSCFRLFALHHPIFILRSFSRLEQFQLSIACSCHSHQSLDIQFGFFLFTIQSRTNNHSIVLRKTSAHRMNPNEWILKKKNNWINNIWRWFCKAATQVHWLFVPMRKIASQIVTFH